MQITDQKYKLGDTVFYMDFNRIQKETIFAVSFVTIDDSKKNFVYALAAKGEAQRPPEDGYWINESDLFTSKEELIKTL